MEIIQFENFIKKIDWWYLKQYFTGRISLFRYYQNIFIKQFGAECQGKVFEIGADQSWSYNNYFPKANEYLHTNIIGDFDLIVDATNMFSITDNSVDVIVCISVLEHIYEHKEASNEIERVLKPGGSFYCLEFSTPKSSLTNNIYNFYNWEFSIYLICRGRACRAGRKE